MIKRTTVKADCPSCGAIETDIGNVVLRVLEGGSNDEGEYRFNCPLCKKIVLKQASPNIIRLLAQAGARTEYYSLSIELLQHPREEDAAPISLDDVIELHFNLEQDEEGWIERMGDREE